MTPAQQSFPDLYFGDLRLTVTTEPTGTARLDVEVDGAEWSVATIILSGAAVAGLAEMLRPAPARAAQPELCPCAADARDQARHDSEHGTDSDEAAIIYACACGED